MFPSPGSYSCCSAFGCVATGIRIHAFLPRVAGTTFAVTVDRSRPNDTLKPHATKPRESRIKRAGCVTKCKRRLAAGWPEACAPAQGGRRIHSGGCSVSTKDRARCESAGPTQAGAGSNRPRAARRSGFSPTFQVDFFARFCVESCDFLRKAWPCHTAGPMRLGVLRARPETATSSGFAEALSEQFGPLPAISGTRPACVSLSGSP